MARLRLAVIGVGHLGKEHARILAALPAVELVGVADVNADQAEAVARRCGTRAFATAWPLLNLVDAAVVAVPTSHHHAVAGEFLRRGISILVEKPLAATCAQAEELVELAARHGALLQVGHIERFNPAFEELQRRPLQAKFIDCRRLGPYTGRSTDIGAVLDLMIHDLDLARALLGCPARAAEAVGATVFGGHEDVVNARLTFANGCVVSLTASRAHPEPYRRMGVWAPEGYAGVDFAKRQLTLIQPSAVARRHGLDARLARGPDGLFGGQLEVLDLDCNRGDQLTRELEHFVQCVRTGARPRVSGEDGRDAIALAEQVLASLRAHPWEGRADGPTGPLHLPQPLGPLFPPQESGAAA